MRTRRNRATGAFILIDEATNDTVARRHGGRRACDTALPRSADPYRDLAVIDSRAPRFNQAVVGALARRARDGLVVAARAARAAARCRADLRSALLPAVPRATSSSSSRASARGRSRTRARRARRTSSVSSSSTAASIAYAAGADTLGAALGSARRRACAARGRDRLLHRLRGLQAALLRARRAVRVVPVAPALHALS